MTSSTKTLLAGLAADVGMPRAMLHFIDTMRRMFLGDVSPADDRCRDAARNGGQRIGTYCLLTPEELIYAAGAVPVRLCGGSHEAALAGDELVPRDVCPVVRASAGFTALGLLRVYQQCDAVIVPTTCDGKRKLGELLAEYVPVWMLEVPHIKLAERSRMEWIDQIYALKRSLEKLTGRRVTRRSLKDAIGKTTRARGEARRLHELRKASPPVVLGRYAMLALNAYGCEPVDEWTPAMAELNDELEQRHRQGRYVARADAPRILLTGSPVVFPNWKLPSLIERSGAVIVADETCAAGRYLHDPACVTEGSLTEMIRSIAARALMPCTCPSFSPNDDRIYRLRQLAQDFSVSGVIYHVLKGCVIYDFETARVERAMQQLGIPVLRVETDYSPEDIEQLRTRIEAFIEMTRITQERVVT